MPTESLKKLKIIITADVVINSQLKEKFYQPPRIQISTNDTIFVIQTIVQNI